MILSNTTQRCLILLALVLGPLASWADAATRPIIVFILADDLGYMDIRANNQRSFYKTPNIDRLAARGMQLMQGHAEPKGPDGSV